MRISGTGLCPATHRPRCDSERAPGGRPGEEHGDGVTVNRLPTNCAQGKADRTVPIRWDVPLAWFSETTRLATTERSAHGMARPATPERSNEARYLVRSRFTRG